MFKHLLLPTDGSKSSEAMIHKAIAFARDAHAQVTAIHVTEPFHTFSLRAEMLEDTGERYERDSRARADHYLGMVQREAGEKGVACDTICVSSDHPYDAIIEAAQRRECDLIMMASHGRNALSVALIGSETQKVLSHCRIPVLVYREPVAA